MGRGRSSSSSSGGRPSSSLFGRSKPQPSAPSRQSSTMAAPTTSAPPVNTRQHAPTPAAAPAPVHAPAPAPSSHAPPAVTPASSVSSPLAGSQVGSGGGLMSGILGTVVQGMAFGTGSAVAHRAVDAIAGPRTVVHEHKTDGDAPVAATTAASTAAVAAPAAAASSNFDDIDRTNCKDESSQFKQCINGGNLSNCQFLFDVLSQCRSTAQQNKNWNY